MYKRKILFVSGSKNWKNGHPNYLSYFTNVLFYILFIICVNTAFPVFVEKLNLLLLFFFGLEIYNKQCMYKVHITPLNLVPKSQILKGDYV